MTITLKNVACGTELNPVQGGVPDVIPAEACSVGWQESLKLLKGEPRHFRTQSSRGDNLRVHRGFCAGCGSPVLTKFDSNPHLLLQETNHHYLLSDARNAVPSNSEPAVWLFPGNRVSVRQGLA